MSLLNTSQNAIDEKLGIKVNADVDVDVISLETAYREALAAFKKDKTNKDLRRSKSAAKKAWDEAIRATQDGEQLNCRDCSQMFMFTTEDEKFYLKNNWLHRPSRCKACSEVHKLRLENRSHRDSKTKNMCYAFQKGECGYGDKCKFSHDPKGRKNDSTDGNSNGDDSGNKDDSSIFNKDGKVISGKEKKIAKEVPFIAKCKWGSKCTMKKCRFSHDDSSSLPNDKETKKSNIGIANDNHETNNSSTSMEVCPELTMKKSKNGKVKKSAVVKAMTKALKKTPSKQLKMKELRKLIKASIDDEKENNLSKVELKAVMTKAIASSEKCFEIEGKIVKLIQ